MLSLRRARFALLLSLCALFPVLASAATVDYRVLIDSDDDRATGCTVAGMSGVDDMLVTRVETTSTSARVVSSYRVECTGVAFGPQLDVNNAGWAAGLQAASGQVWFENRIPFSAFGSSSTLPTEMRFGFEAKTFGPTHSILNHTNGKPILFPPATNPRRHSVGPQRNITIDEKDDDWGMMDPEVKGAAKSGNDAVRLLNIFLYASGTDHHLYIGTDSFISSDAVYAQNDNYVRQIGQGLNVNAPGVLANDADPNGAPITALPVSNAKHGDITLNPDGSFTYSPDNPNIPRTDTFEYKATNGTENSNVARVKIKVSIGNDPPDAVDDQYSTPEDVQLNVAAPGVMTNDTDPDGDPLVAALLTAPSHGTLTLNPDGGFTYKPANNFHGTDTFSYTISDLEESDTANVTIIVTSGNDDPVAANVSVTTNEEVPVAVTLSATDIEGDPLTFNVNNPANGVLSGTAPNLTYTPNPNFFGTDTFTYTATDGEDVSNVATVTITVNPVNDPPSFTTGGNVTSAEDAAYNAQWATNISPGAPNETSDVLTFNITNNTNPALFASGPSISSTGVLSFTPVPNVSGAANITVNLSDNGGGSNTSAPVVFTITITPVNDPPSFTSGGNVTVNEDSGAYNAAWATAISKGPADEAGQTLTFNITNNTNAALFSAGPTISSTGVLSFTPAANAFGSADITVTLSDNGGGTNTSAPVTFTITVTGVNDEPSFTAGPNVTVDEDSGAYSAAWATGISAGPNEGTQTLTFNITANSNPALFATGPAIDAAGTLSFTLNANVNGAANITVELKDNGGTANGGDDTSPSVVRTITVNAVNDAPSFTSGGNVTVNEDSGAYNAAWATSISKGPADEIGQVLTFNVTGNTNPGLFLVAPSINATTGNLSFTPAANANGSSDITITLSDDGGGTNTSAPVTFTIFVTAVNDEPSFVSGGDVSSNEDTPYSAAWATSISKGPPDESLQTLTFNILGNTNPSLFLSGPAIDASGNLTYTPALNASGFADITVNLTDSGSNTAPNDNTSASVIFKITINPVNDAPVITAANIVSWNENDPPVTLATALTIADVDSVNATCVAAGDCYVSVTGNADANDVLDCPGCAGQGITANWSWPTLTLTGNVSLGNYQNAMRTVRFTNTSDTPSQSARVVDWFIKDDAGAQNADTAANDTTVNVTAVNDAPSNSVPGAQITDEDFAITFSGNISVSDPDAGTSPVKVNLVATSGTLTLSGTTGLTFTDGDGSGDVTMEFTGSITDINAALNGMVYSPTPDFNGAGSVSILTNDQGNTGNGGALSSNGGTPNVVSITINAVNDEPSFVSGGNVTVNEDSGAYNQAWATSISKGPADENTQVLTFNVVVNSGASLFSVPPAINTTTGNLSFTLNPNVNGTANITVTLSDDGSNTAPNDNISPAVSFDITVDPVNDEPSFVSGGDVTVDEDSSAYNAAWATSISKGPADEATQNLTFNVNVDSGASLFSIPPAIDAGTGNLSFTLNANANGSAQITVTLTDDGSNTPPSDNTSAPVTFTITVNPINDEPSFTSGGNVSVVEDSGAYSASWATSISKGPPDESLQNLTFNVTVDTNASLFQVAPSINASGVLSFTPAADAFGTADISVYLTDDGATGGANDNTSPTVSFQIEIRPKNDAPSFTSGGNVTVLEDSAAYNAAWATAISKGPANEGTQNLTFNVVVNSGAALFSIPPAVNTTTGNLTFTLNANANGSASITVTLSDDGGVTDGGVDTSAPANFMINVTAVNDAPSFVVNDPPFTAKSATPSAQLATVATSILAGPTVDETSTQTVSFNVTNNTNPGLFSVAPTVNSSGQVSYTAAANVGGSAVITIVAQDTGGVLNGGVDTSAGQTFTIAVEEGPSVLSSSPLEGAMTVNPTDNIVINFSEPVSIDSGGLTINCGGAQAYTATPVAGGFSATHTFDPNSNLPSTNCTVTLLATAVHDQDSFDPPDNLAGNFTLNFTVNTPPVAKDDVENALGNLQLVVSDANGVIQDGGNDDDDGVGGNNATDGQDTDPDPGAVLTIQSLGPFTGTAGGTLTFTSGGGYTYISEAGDQNVDDVFTYTLQDNNGSTDTGQLTIHVGQRYIFCDDTGVAGDGRSTSPFHTLQAAQAGSTTNDKIIVFAGTYTDFITLQSGQHLIGQGIDANLTDTFNGDMFTVLTAGASPSLSRSTAGATITLGSNNTIKGALVGSSAGAAILGNGFGTLTVGDDLDVNTTGGSALDLTNGTVSGTFDTLTAASGASSALNLVTVGGTFSATNAASTLSSTTGATININGGTHTFTYPGSVSTTGTSVFAATGKTSGTFTVSGGITGSGRLSIANSTGATYTFSGLVNTSTGTTNGVELDTYGTANFNGGVQLAATTGTAFSAINAGTLTIAGTTNTITTNGAASFALRIAGTTLSGTATFSNITSTGASTAVHLAGMGNGNVTINGGAINGGATGILISAVGTSTITLSGLTIGDTTPPTSAAISGATFGTLAISGAAVNVTGVTALSLATGTVTGTFNTVSSTGGNTNGVSLTGVNGTWGATSGTLTGATGSTFNVSGGGGQITWGGAITQANGANVVQIAGSNTSVINFNGNVQSSGTSTGVNIASSSGTYNFNGGTNTLAGSGAGITLAAVTGNISFASGTQITNALTSFKLSGTSTANITFSGTISNTSNNGLLLDINNSTAGSYSTGTINFNNTGNLTGNVPGANGVRSVINSMTGTLSVNNLSLTSSNNNFAGTLLTIGGTNTAGSFTFNNLDLSATGTQHDGKGLVMSGGGTLTITATGGASTIDVGNTALDLSNIALGTGAIGTLNSLGDPLASAVILNTVTGGTLTIGGGALTCNTASCFLVTNGSASVTYNGTITQASANNAVSVTGHATGTLAFGGVITASVDGADLFFDNADGTYNFSAANAFTNGAGINITNGSGGTFSFSSNASSVTNGLVGANNACFTVNSSTPDITYSGNLTRNGTSNGRLVDITTFGAGKTITFQTGTLSATSTGATSTGILLSDADGTVNFSGTTTLSGGDAGIDVLAGSGGTITFAETATVTNPTNQLFTIDASSPTFTYSGSFTKNNNNNNAINVTSNSGGTIKFDGDSLTNGSDGALETKVLSSGTGNAVNLTSNAGATIEFSGSTLNITTSTGRGFNATGAGPAATTGGTVKVLGTVNTITVSGSGTGVYVEHTTIGTGGLNFQSVNATGGPTYGVYLNNTGSTAGITVTGTGAANSGGQITNASNHGISLTSTRSPSFTDVRVDNSANNAIFGSSVVNMALSNSSFINSGDTDANNEGGGIFSELTGTVNITNCKFNGNFEDNARIENTTGTLTLTVSGCEFNDNSSVSPGNDGFMIHALSAAPGNASITATITTSSFLRNRAKGLQVQQEGTGTVTVNVGTDEVAGSGGTFQDNDVSVSFEHNSAGPLNFGMYRGSFSSPTKSAAASRIQVNMGTGSTVASLVTGTIEDNTLSTPNSATGPSIFVKGNGAGTMGIAIENNNITQDLNHGINVIARDGSNTVNARITSNVVSVTSSSGGAGIRVDSAAASADTTKICLDITNNNATTAVSPGIDPINGFGISVRQRLANSKFFLEGYTDAGNNDSANAQAYVAGNNSPSTVYADASTLAAFENSGGCPTP